MANEENKDFDAMLWDSKENRIFQTRKRVREDFSALQRLFFFTPPVVMK